MIVTVGTTATEHKVLCDDNSYKGGGPVANQSNKILEVEEEFVGSTNGCWNDNGGNNNGEDVAWNTNQPRHQGLEVECNGVHGATGVSEQRKGEDNDTELAEATSA